jgi:hypothetical protein
MTNEEIICTFMEPRPECAPIDICDESEWWVAGQDKETLVLVWRPASLTLDRLREVEARLSEDRWREYARYMDSITGDGLDRVQDLLHASAEQKIEFLAEVLRSGA